MDLKTLEIFVETMQERSFSAVARKRAVDPSTVSREIARLEKLLKVQLFEREGQVVVPTQAAEGYLEKILLPLKELDQACQDAQGLSGELQGMITLAASQALCTEYLMPHLESWRREYPLVTVQLLVREELLIDFSRQAIDLGFQTGSGPNIGASQLLDVNYKLCASPKWAPQQALGDPRQLPEIECLTGRSEWRFSNPFGDSHRVTLRGGLQCEDSQVLRAAALHGLGPAVLPDWLVTRHLKRGELVELLPTWRVERVGFEMGIWAVWPGRNLSRKGRVFLQRLAKGR